MGRCRIVMFTVVMPIIKGGYILRIMAFSMIMASFECYRLLLIHNRGISEWGCGFCQGVDDDVLVFKERDT
ncbi:MAG: hypothetical protein HQK94_19125 [Nitrospirae bacterium]|nr:hypothetical protein [Nitrospirota bacterium]